MHYRRYFLECLQIIRKLHLESAPHESLTPQCIYRVMAWSHFRKVFEFTQGSLLKVAPMTLWIPGMFQGKDCGRCNHYLSELSFLLPPITLSLRWKWDDCLLWWRRSHMPWEKNKNTDCPGLHMCARRRQQTIPLICCGDQSGVVEIHSTVWINHHSFRSEQKNESSAECQKRLCSFLSHLLAALWCMKPFSKHASQNGRVICSEHYSASYLPSSLHCN